MALETITNGSQYSTTVKGWRLRLDYTITTDLTQNKSSAQLFLYVYHNCAAYNNKARDAYYTITGAKTFITLSYPATPGWVKLNQNAALRSVQHNADGTGSITFSTSRFYTGILDDENIPNELVIDTFTVTLPTVPQSSKLVTSNLKNTTNYIGSQLPISWTIDSSYESYFTHKLQYQIMGQSSKMTIVSSIQAGTAYYNWTVPTSFYAFCPNSTQLIGTLTLTTYLDGEALGSDEQYFYVFVKSADNVPTITMSFSDTNPDTYALTGNALRMVKGYSTIEVTCTGTGIHHASIMSNTISYDRNVYSVSTATHTQTFTEISSAVFKGIVTDSRGLTSTVTPNTTLINYFKPTIIPSVLMTITDATGTTAKAEITLKINCFTGNFGAVSNSATVKYRYRQSGGTWSSYTTVTASGSTYAATIQNLDGTKTYEFQGQIIDKLETVTSNVVKTTALPVFDFDKDDFNFNVPLNINGDLTCNGKTVDYIVKSGSAANGLNYCLWNSGKSECWGTITATVSATTSTAGWYGGTSSNYNFPTYSSNSIFTAAPCLVSSAEADSHIFITNHAITNTKFSLYVTAPQSASLSVKFHVYAIGTWK